MSALELAGLLPEVDAITSTMIDRWIEATLAQAAALREHDRWLYPTDAALFPVAERLHAAWRHWAHNSELLLNRAAALNARNNAVRNVDELRDVVGRTHAMLQLTPTVVAERRKKADAGDVYTIEEVRRELRRERDSHHGN